MRDADGFSLPRENNGEPVALVRVPPPAAEMPKFFDGCASTEEAIARMIAELSKPAAINHDGFDTMYRRLADALILLLAIEGGLSP